MRRAPMPEEHIDRCHNREADPVLVPPDECSFCRTWREAALLERDRVQPLRDAAVNVGQAWDALTRMGPHKLTHVQAAQYDQISAAVGELFEVLTATKAEEICWSCEETKICQRVMYATSPTDPTLKAHRWCDVCAHAHVHGLENEHDCGEGEDA